MRIHRTILLSLALAALGATTSLAATLYGVTGDGAATPESLYVLDASDASSAFVRGFGDGDGGGEPLGPPPTSTAF